MEDAEQHEPWESLKPGGLKGRKVTTDNHFTGRALSLSHSASTVYERRSPWRRDPTRNNDT